MGNLIVCNVSCHCDGWHYDGCWLMKDTHCYSYKFSSKFSFVSYQYKRSIDYSLQYNDMRLPTQTQYNSLCNICGAKYYFQNVVCIYDYCYIHMYSYRFHWIYRSLYENVMLCSDKNYVVFLGAQLSLVGRWPWKGSTAIWTLYIWHLGHLLKKSFGTSCSAWQEERHCVQLVVGPDLCYRRWGVNLCQLHDLAGDEWNWIGQKKKLSLWTSHNECEVFVVNVIGCDVCDEGWTPCL